MLLYKIQIYLFLARIDGELQGYLILLHADFLSLSEEPSFQMHNAREPETLTQNPRLCELPFYIGNQKQATCISIACAVGKFP